MKITETTPIVSREITITMSIEEFHIIRAAVGHAPDNVYEKQGVSNPNICGESRAYLTYVNLAKFPI